MLEEEASIEKSVKNTFVEQPLFFLLLQKIPLLYIFKNKENIYRGRKGLDTDGEEHEGRLSYEAGLSEAFSTFQEVQSSKDTQIFVLSELVYLQQELQFCNESDKSTKNSLNIAIQSFEDALRCLKTVDDPAAYRITETTYPTDDNNRIKTLPRDAVHQGENCYTTQNRRLAVLNFSV